MESHPYEIDRGATPDPGLDSVIPSKKKRPSKNTCRHLNARGHYCRMLPKINSKFCKLHQADAQPTTEELAAELLGSVPDLSTAPNVNLFLGNLVRQFAHRRIERRDAITLAYLGQLLLNSLAALDRKDKLDSNRPPTIIFDMPRPGYGKYFEKPSGDTAASSNPALSSPHPNNPAISRSPEAII